MFNVEEFVVLFTCHVLNPVPRKDVQPLNMRFILVIFWRLHPFKSALKLGATFDPLLSENIDLHVVDVDEPMVQFFILCAFCM